MSIAKLMYSCSFFQPSDDYNLIVSPRSIENRPCRTTVPNTIVLCVKGDWSVYLQNRIVKLVISTKVMRISSRTNLPDCYETIAWKQDYLCLNILYQMYKVEEITQNDYTGMEQFNRYSQVIERCRVYTDLF